MFPVSRMSRRTLRLAFITTVSLGVASVPAANAQETLFGLTDNSQLFRFSSTAPGTFTSLTGVANTVTGVSNLVGDDTLLSIDIRPQDGLLYGLSQNFTTNALRLYTISTTGATAGQATLLSTLTPAQGSNGVGGTTAAQPFAASFRFHIDFNPQADALRIVDGGANGTGNYRLTAANFATGITASDAPINNRNAQDANVAGIAYTNNVVGAQTTTLYDLVLSNNSTDTLYIQTPANSGTLVLPAGTARGNTGQFFSGTGDLDVSGMTGFAYQSDGGTFYRLNLTTGAATSVGSFNGAVGNVLGIAAPVGVQAAAPEPAASSLLMLGLPVVGLRIRRRRISA